MGTWEPTPGGFDRFLAELDYAAAVEENRHRSGWVALVFDPATGRTEARGPWPPDAAGYVAAVASGERYRVGLNADLVDGEPEWVVTVAPLFPEGV